MTEALTLEMGNLGGGDIFPKAQSVRRSCSSLEYEKEHFRRNSQCKDLRQAGVWRTPGRDRGPGCWSTVGEGDCDPLVGRGLAAGPCGLGQEPGELGRGVSRGVGD